MSPDRPGPVSKRVFVHLQLCDLRATQIGWYRVRDDLTKAETDHQSDLWRLVCGEHLVRDECAESVAVATISEVQGGVADGDRRLDVGRNRTALKSSWT